MRVIKAKVGNMIQLGKVGTSETTEVIFDVSRWTDGLSEFSFELIHQRYGDDEPYPVSVTYSALDNTVTWVVANSDVAKEGWGKCELILVSGSAVAKSQTYGTVVHKAIGEALDPPAEYQTWVDKVISAGANAKLYAEQASTSATSASASAEASATSAEDASTSASNAKTSEDNAQISATDAADSATDAYNSAERAEQAAKTAGYMFFSNEEGRLIYTKTTNVETDFDLVNGRLEVTIP